MKRRFYISDTHFGHANMLRFSDHLGAPLREFDSVEHMDEHMIERWNSTVRDCDTVYHLGDVAIAKRSIAIMGRLSGRKILVKGNHDIFKLKDYTPWFKDIRACVCRDGVIFTHIPVHGRELYRFGANVHGHTHTEDVHEPGYLNVCVEKVDYTPVEHDDIIARLANQEGGWR